MTIKKSTNKIIIKILQTMFYTAQNKSIAFVGNHH